MGALEGNQAVTGPGLHFRKEVSAATWTTEADRPVEWLPGGDGARAKAGAVGAQRRGQSQVC